MRPRLLVQGPLAAGRIATLDDTQGHYLGRVLRLRPGDPVQVFDGEGHRFDATVESAERGGWTIRLDAAAAPTPESPVDLCLAQCVSGGEKMDWTIEKAVELGVRRIAPLLSSRSVVRLDDERVRRRGEHWRRLIAAACAQCGRDTLPSIDAPRPLAEWIHDRDARRTGVVLVPGASAPLSQLALPEGAIDLLVGPEGGLDDAEVAAAVRAGMQAVSLGPRVLRTETAGLVALALLQGRAGDL